MLFTAKANEYHFIIIAFMGFVLLVLDYLLISQVSLTETPTKQGIIFFFSDTDTDTEPISLDSQ